MYRLLTIVYFWIGAFGLSFLGFWTYLNLIEGDFLWALSFLMVFAVFLHFFSNQYCHIARKIKKTDRTSKIKLK